MLVSTLEHATDHNYLSARMQRAFDFLREADLAALPLGRVDIDGDEVFANVQEYATVPADSKQFEAHRAYYDVQFMVSGEEVMQYAPLDALAPVQDFDIESDFGLYDGQGIFSQVVLRAGEFAVVAPEDAHKPGCQVAGECANRKVVVKVRA